MTNRRSFMTACVVLMATASGCSYPPLPPLDGDAAHDDATDTPDSGPEADAVPREVFARAFVGDGSASIESIVSAPDGVILTGIIGTDPIELGGGLREGLSFVAQFTPEGDHSWSRGLPVLVNAIASDADGNVYATGGFHRAVSLGGPVLFPADQQAVEPRDMFVVKYDRDGGHVWSRGYGGRGVQDGRRLAVLPDGSIVVCGTFREYADFGGTPLRTADRWDEDVFCVKLTAGEGAFVWSTAFGGAGTQTTDALVTTSGGTAVLFGSLFPNSGAWAVGLGGSGNADWMRQINGGGVRAAAIARGTDVLITGAFSSQLDLGEVVLQDDGMPASYVARMSAATGTVAWATAYRGRNGPRAIASLDEDVVVVGTYTATTVFGDVPLSTSGAQDNDIFVARHRHSNGTVTSAQRYGGVAWDHGDAMTLLRGATGPTAVIGGTFESESIDFGVDVLQKPMTGVMFAPYLARVRL